jgi:DNA-binding IclR family transcriptional regulator
MVNKRSAEGSSGALRRGLQILALLHRNHPASLSIQDISSQSGLPRPTVYRLLEALIDEGCATRCQQSGNFEYIGLGSRLPLQPLQHKNLEVVMTRMKNIAQRTGDSVYLVIQNGVDSMCVHRELGHYPIQVNSLAVGQRQPLGIGSGGLSILAAGSDEELERVIQVNTPRFTHYNGLSATTVKQLVHNTRSRGYAIIGSYAIPGVTGVGMAVFDNGKPIAGLCVSSTTERMSIAHQRLIAKCLQEALSGLR